MVPPTLHCMRCNNYLPPLDARFGTQDYHLKQPKITLAYAKALQHWAKVAKPLPPGEPCQFMDPLSPWVMVTPSQCSEVAEGEALEAMR